MTLRILFVCSEARLRSATAEGVFSELDGIEAIAAGTNADADPSVSGDLIEWADEILVMEPDHRRKLTEKFAPLLRHKEPATPGIADRYTYMQPELVELPKARVPRHVRLPG